MHTSGLTNRLFAHRLSPSWRKSVSTPLCPVFALCIYLYRTRALLKSAQIFISWCTSPCREALFSPAFAPLDSGSYYNDTLYSSKGLTPLEGSRAHYTRGIDTSWTLIKASLFKRSFNAACWATPIPSRGSTDWT